MSIFFPLLWMKWLSSLKKVLASLLLFIFLLRLRVETFNWNPQLQVSDSFGESCIGFCVLESGNWRQFHFICFPHWLWLDRRSSCVRIWVLYVDDRPLLLLMMTILLVIKMQQGRVRVWQCLRGIRQNSAINPYPTRNEWNGTSILHFHSHLRSLNNIAISFTFCLFSQFFIRFAS